MSSIIQYGLVQKTGGSSAERESEVHNNIPHLWWDVNGFSESDRYDRS